jgi:hypothetical protein
MQTLTINHHYDFSVYANAVLGVSYKNARLDAILDYHTALRFENIVLLHRQVYPYLPDGTLEDLTRYTYFLFKVGDKDVVMADVWLVSGSVVQSSGTTHTLRLMNVSSGELSIVRDQLRLLGISFLVD